MQMRAWGQIRHWGLAIAAIYALVVIAMAGPAGPGDFLWLLSCYTATIVTLAAGVAALWAACRIARFGLPTAIAWPVTRRFDRVVPLTTFAITMAAFTLFKQSMLPQAGFAFGQSIAVTEQAMLGRDAWQVTHALLRSPLWSQAIDLAYHAWFAPMTLGMVLCAFAPRDSALATRYMLAFVLVWIVEGSLVAYWLPAAGPCFYDAVQPGPDRFAALHDHLRAQSDWLRATGFPGLSALDYQRELFRAFTTRHLTFGAGISAMPSLHNAMAVLFACAAFHHGRRIGYLFAAYAVVIAVGSVHLGWHYAMDGIVAAAMTMAIWKLTGVIVHATRTAAGVAPAPEPQAVAARMGTNP